MPSQTNLDNMVKYCFLSKYERKHGTVFLNDCIGEQSSKLNSSSVTINVTFNITKEDIQRYRDGKL